VTDGAELNAPYAEQGPRHDRSPGKTGSEGSLANADLQKMVRCAPTDGSFLGHLNR
jgi:hypothetical protein